MLGDITKILFQSIKIILNQVENLLYLCLNSKYIRLKTLKRYKIRLGWIGCGFIGQLAHLENFSSLSDVEITALADTKIKLAKKVAKKYGIKKIYNNHLDLLKNEKKL